LNGHFNELNLEILNNRRVSSDYFAFSTHNYLNHSSNIHRATTSTEHIQQKGVDGINNIVLVSG